jgi:hypothetical protein
MDIAIRFIQILWTESELALTSFLSAINSEELRILKQDNEIFPLSCFSILIKRGDANVFKKLLFSDFFPKTVTIAQKILVYSVKERILGGNKNSRLEIIEILLTIFLEEFEESLLQMDLIGLFWEYGYGEFLTYKLKNSTSNYDHKLFMPRPEVRLISATQKQQPNLVYILLSSGIPADVRKVNCDEAKTPLMIAVENKDVDTTTLLLNFNANPFATTQYRARKLKSLQGDISSNFNNIKNIYSFKEKTPLWYAVYSGYTENVALLLEKSSNKIYPVSAACPIELAKKMDRQDLVSLIQMGGFLEKNDKSPCIVDLQSYQ